ncbi:MAG: radical SAM protein [Candidatus Thorarchaeota archaeon]
MFEETGESKMLNIPIDTITKRERNFAGSLTATFDRREKREKETNPEIHRNGRQNLTSQTSERNQVAALESLSKNRLFRFIVNRFTSKQDNHNPPVLLRSLDLMAGEAERKCLSCWLGSLFLKGVISIGSRSFGTDLKTIKDMLPNIIFRRAMYSVIRGIGDFGVTKPFVPGTPFQVVWNVTRTCNLRCKHCYENAGRAGPDELTTEQALRTIDILADEGVVFIAFSGGEPTLRPDILTLIEHAASRGIYVAIATNATTLTRPETVKKLKEAGLSFVQISLDGVNPQTHDEFRGVRGAYDKTITGIKNCVREDLFVEIAMTVTHYNLREVPAVIDLSQELGARWFMAYNFIPTGRGSEIVNADLTPQEREELLQYLWGKIISKSDPNMIEVLSTAPQLGRIPLQVSNDDIGQVVETFDGQVFPTHFANARLPAKMEGLAEFIGGCGAGRFYVAIEPNGDIYPCVFFPHTPQVKVGNILRDDFHTLWTTSQVLLELRDKDLLQDHCGSCEYRYVCGGCRARALRYNGSYLAPDPGCINNLTEWYKLKGAMKKTEMAKSV